MRFIIMSVIALISYVLQTTLLGFVQIYGVKPNLILIITIAYALIRGREEGAIYGLFSGLLVDIMSGKIIGIYAVMGLYFGLIIGSLYKSFYKENYFIPMALTTAGTIVYKLILYAVMYVVDGQTHIISYLLGYVLPEALYNTLLSIFVYFLLLYVNKKIDYYGKTMNNSRHWRA